MNTGPTWSEKARYLGSLYTLTLLPHHPKSRPHWNQIVPGLILGGVPIQTHFLGRGNHGEKLINQCLAELRPLSLVVSVMEPWELEGIGPIRPVPVDYWTQRKIDHHLLEMQDFTGTVNVDDIDQEVDAIHEAIQSGKSAYVHCKAGRGRSFLVVFCYLMKHEKMNADDALATIIAARPQVSPSKSQFATIEEYRQKFAKDVDPINIYSEHFYPYRKDWLSYLSSSKVHGLIALTGSLLLLGYGILASLAVGVIAKVLSDYVQANIADFDHNQYFKAKAMKNNQDAAFSDKECIAFEEGFKAATSYWAWFKTHFRTSPTLEYGLYRAGCEAGRNKDEDLRSTFKAKA